MKIWNTMIVSYREYTYIYIHISITYVYDIYIYIYTYDTYIYIYMIHTYIYIYIWYIYHISDLCMRIPCMRIPCRISPFLLIIRSQRALSQSPCQSQTSPLPESINLHIYIYIHIFTYSTGYVYKRQKEKTSVFFFSTALRTSFLLLYSTWVLCKEHVHVEMQREQWQKNASSSWNYKQHAPMHWLATQHKLNTFWHLRCGCFFFASAFHRGW